MLLVYASPVSTPMMVPPNMVARKYSTAFPSAALMSASDALGDLERMSPPKCLLYVRQVLPQRVVVLVYNTLKWNVYVAQHSHPFLYTSYMSKAVNFWLQWQQGRICLRNNCITVADNGAVHVAIKGIWKKLDIGVVMRYSQWLYWTQCINQGVEVTLLLACVTAHVKSTMVRQLFAHICAPPANIAVIVVVSMSMLVFALLGGDT